MNKSDRKKLIKTQVIGQTIVFFRADTEAEIARTDTESFPAELQQQGLIYGVKQIVADVNAGEEGEDKFTGIARACEQLDRGLWPTRPKAPVSLESVIASIMELTGKSRAEVEVLQVREG